ncbi:MAG: PKD domain-containing protein, partial [Bacteroidota bacterium]
MRKVYIWVVLIFLATGSSSDLRAQCGTILPLPDPSIDVVPGNAILEDTLIRVCSATPQATLQIFNASTTIPDNQSYTIDWGDGSVENHDNTSFPNSSFLSHLYNGYGYYNLQVTVTGSNGCTATKDYLFYNGSNPSVGLANPGNTVGLCAPATIDFPITNTGNNPAGTDYFIYIGGQLIQSYTQANVPPVFTYTFLDPSCGLSTSTGNYQNAFDVQIVASNPCGSSQATIEPIEVSTPPEPFFDLSHPTLACTDDAITVTDNSSNVNEVYSGNPSICESSLSPSWVISPGVSGIDWTVVSGNIFSSSQIQIVFSTPGSYTVTMTITSPSCGPATFSQSFEILEAPVAGADYDLQSGASPSLPDECVPTAATFLNQSTGDSLSYAWAISPSTGWQYSNGSHLYAEDLEVLFQESGSYQVTLVTSNPCRSVSWDTTIVIASTPIVQLQPAPDFCERATLNFDASNLTIAPNGGNISHYQWEFPGASPPISNTPFPTGIQYNSPGTYTYTLRVDNQCGSQIVRDTFVIQEPGVLTLAPDRELCQDQAGFQLNASPGGGVWTGTGVSPSGWFEPTVGTLGTNTLVYSFLDSGCDLVDSMQVTVYPNPVVVAGESQAACADDEPVILTGESPLGGVWTASGGGVIDATDAFDPQASGVGVFTLTYTYVDANGCEDQDDKTMVVYELPEVEAGPSQSFCFLP